MAEELLAGLTISECLDYLHILATCLMKFFRKLQNVQNY